MSALDHAAKQTVATLLGGLRKGIDAKGWVEPCLITVFPGADVPFDYCDSCEAGQAWVRLVSIAPLPSPDGLPMPCAPGLNAVVEMGMVRGGPIIEEDGELPTSADHMLATELQMEEMGVMFTALTCTPLPTGFNVTVQTYVPIGPGGGCLGGLWLAEVPLQ